MDVEDQVSLGKTLMGLGVFWIVLGFSIGSAFWDHRTGLGLALGGILPLFTGIGVFRHGRKKDS